MKDSAQTFAAARKCLLLGLLLCAALFILFPFFWMLWTAFKVKGGGLSLQFWPGPGEDFSSLYTLRNFTSVAQGEDFPFLLFLRNSFLVAVTSALLTVFVCSLAAYVFAKKNFPGKDLLFWLFMGAMMIPGMMYMVPQFAIITRLGWMNSLPGLVAPHLANVFGVLVLKQYIQTIPDSLLEAAHMDGASEWQIFTRVIVPLSLPALATLFLLTFVGQWNNFLWQLIINTPDSSFITLPVGIQMFKGQYGADLEKQMTAASFSILPLMLLFLFTQRYLIEGLTAGGVKE